MNDLGMFSEHKVIETAYERFALCIESGKSVCNVEMKYQVCVKIPRKISFDRLTLLRYKPAHTTCYYEYMPYSFWKYKVKHDIKPLYNYELIHDEKFDLVTYYRGVKN